MEEDSVKYYKTTEQFEKDNIQLLIELDSKNAINKVEEPKPVNKIHKIDEPMTINLGNGIRLEVGESNLVNGRPKFDQEFHFNNFIKILHKMLDNNKSTKI